MRRECPNRKRVLLTEDGYVSASDDEKIDEPSSEKSKEDDLVSVNGYEAAAHLQNLMVQRVPKDRIEGQG